MAVNQTVARDKQDPEPLLKCHWCHDEGDGDRIKSTWNDVNGDAIGFYTVAFEGSQFPVSICEDCFWTDQEASAIKSIKDSIAKHRLGC